MTTEPEIVYGTIHADESNLLWRSSPEDYGVNAEEYARLVVGMQFWIEAVFPSETDTRWYIRDDFWGDRTLVVYLNFDQYMNLQFLDHLQSLLKFPMYSVARIILVSPPNFGSQPIAIYPGVFKLGSRFEGYDLKSYLDKVV